jgi:uncharacterized membrane protein YccC
MSVTAPWAGDASSPPRLRSLVRRLVKVFDAAGPSLLFGLRVWASASLALYVAFWLELDNPFWAGITAVIVCQPRLGASLRKGWSRMIGTAIGAVMCVVLVACFPQDRLLFLGSLAVWGAFCAAAATLLRNVASYGAALAGYTAAIIAGDLLGSTGGLDGNAAFLLAVARATEICLGVVCAGVVLAGTDLGGAPRRLAARFADLAAAITAGIVSTLTIMGCEFNDTQPIPSEFIRRVVALDPEVDQTLGETGRIRYHSSALQSAVDGLFMALAGWHAIAKLHQLPAGEARRDAASILEYVAPELQSASQPDAAECWMHDPVALDRGCDLTVQRLIALPATSPSQRLLADKAAEAFAGIALALSGIGLLIASPTRPIPYRGNNRFRVPDWLPPLVSAGRAFVAISVAMLFWIVTGWPGGATMVTYAMIALLLLAPYADQAYSATIFFIVGTIIALVIAAVVAFAVLPAQDNETFVGLSLGLAAFLVPASALLARTQSPLQSALFMVMAVLFVSFLEPTNPMNYDPQAFYNVGEETVFGFGFAAVSFRLLPPLSPAFLARRLIALTLRDLRRLAKGRHQSDWNGLAYGRLSAMPDQTTPSQRAQLLAIFSVGSEIIGLRRIALRLGFAENLSVALAALAARRSAQAVAQLIRLDDMLAANAAGEPPSQDALRARGSILVLTETLTKHAVWIDAGGQT